MNQILNNSHIEVFLTSLLTLCLLSPLAQAERAKKSLYQSKVYKLDKKISALDLASKKTRQAHNRSISNYQRLYAKITKQLKLIVERHKRKRTWGAIARAKRLTFALNQAGEKFERKARLRIRKIYYIERNRTQLLHQRADASIDWSIEELSRRIQQLRKALKRENELELGTLIGFLLSQRDALMKKRIHTHSIFQQNMKELSLREARDLKYFAPTKPE